MKKWLQSGKDLDDILDAQKIQTFKGPILNAFINDFGLFININVSNQVMNRSLWTFGEG